jgi:hypothetical protein
MSFDRKITIHLTEDEWQALCEMARRELRNPKLQALYLLRIALALPPKKEQPEEHD